MAGMFATGSSWFCVIVGVVTLAEVVVLFVRGRTGTRAPDGRLPMLLSMAVMLISGGVARLSRLNGAEMTIAVLVGLCGAAATLYFAIRSMNARRKDATG